MLGSVGLWPGVGGRLKFSGCCDIAFLALLYWASSFFRIVSASLRFALLMMVAIALWHRTGMSSSFGASVRWRTFVARDGVGLLFGCGLGSGGDGDCGAFLMRCVM